MQWSDISFDPARKTLRQFAGLCLVVFGAMALWEAFGRGHTRVASIFALLALTIGPLGLVRPEWIRWIYVGWMVLALPVGWTVSQMVLALLFYALFTPIGIIFKLLGRDPLHRARQLEVASYWSPKETPADLQRYFKQF